MTHDVKKPEGRGLTTEPTLGKDTKKGKVASNSYDRASDTDIVILTKSCVP